MWSFGRYRGLEPDGRPRDHPPSLLLRATLMSSTIDTISVRSRLFVALVAYETIAIIVMILAGFNIATSHGGTAIMAAPLLLIAAAEAMRIHVSRIRHPLAAGWPNLAMLALLVIAIGSFEALSLALEQFVNARVANVMSAGHEVESAERAVQEPSRREVSWTWT